MITRRNIMAWLGISGFMAGDAQAQLIVSTDPTYSFMTVKVTDHGQLANEKFFLGRLPTAGETVDMVYVGEDERDPGSMRFQLRVR
jgi:hypothetical protein